MKEGIKWFMSTRVYAYCRMIDKVYKIPPPPPPPTRDTPQHCELILDSSCCQS